MNTENQLEQREDEIDLIALLSELYKSRMFIFKSATLFTVFGLFVALVSPKVFKAEAVFVVQDSDKQVSSSLSGLAALAGVNLQSESMGAIPPSLYPNIVSGIPFKLELLNTTVETSGISYRTYLLNKNSSFFATIKKYTIGLPFFILKSLKSESDAIVNSVSDLKQLDAVDFELTEILDELVSVQVNEKEGFITLSALDSDPKVAAVVGSKALAILQERLTLFKTNNAKRILDFVQQQYTLKENQYNQIQQELASFKDQNKNISTAVFESNLEKLQTRYDLIYGVYLELSKQLEQAKLQVNKDIPNISILEPIYVPNKKNAPKGVFILVIFTFLGVVLSCGWVLISNPLKQIANQIRS